MAKNKSIRKQKDNLFMGGAGAAEHAIQVYGGINEQHPVSQIDNTIQTRSLTGHSGGWPWDPASPPTESSPSKQPVVTQSFDLPPSGGNLTKEKLQQLINKTLKNLKKQQGGSVVIPLQPGFTDGNTWVDVNDANNVVSNSISNSQLSMSNAVAKVGGSQLSPMTLASESTSLPQIAQSDMQKHNVQVSIKGGQINFKQLEKRFKQVGGKLQKKDLEKLQQQLQKLEQQQQGGIGLEELVVPAILLVANQKYGKKSETAKKFTSSKKIRSFRSSRRMQ
jgi:hypothetical protein